MLTFGCFSYTAQTQLPRDGNAHSGLDPPTSISNQENDPQTCPQASLMEVTPQLSFLLPRYVKLTPRLDITVVLVLLVMMLLVMVVLALVLILILIMLVSYSQ